MSLTTSLNNAYSGLSASSRRAEIVSNNVSNAMVEDYSRKSLEVSSNRLGGVRLDGIVRSEDPIATAARRLNDARLGSSSAKTEALSQVQKAFGLPGESTALANLASDFESDLRALSNAPASIPDARAVLTSATRYADKIRAIADENENLRTMADANIAQNVKTLNDSLEKIEDLNTLIVQAEISGQDVTSLMDERDAHVDKVSTIVAVDVYKRKDGAIALFSPAGGVLLDGRARVFEFTQSTVVTPAMSLAGGSLSGLSVDGEPVNVGTSPGYFDGGSLEAHFELRDTTIPEVDSRLDALAKDIIERLQDPAVDPTLAVGDPGLFTDAGAFFDPLNELGVAGRIEINAAIDPNSGGSLTNIRDGVNATAPLDSGDNTIVRNILDALTARVIPSANLMIPSSLSAPDLSAALTADIAQLTTNQEEQFSYLTGEQTLLRSAELNTTGVDTDDEMQQLIAIEQAYAANARVISVVDELMQTLLSL